MYLIKNYVEYRIFYGICNFYLWIKIQHIENFKPVTTTSHEDVSMSNSKITDGLDISPSTKIHPQFPLPQETKTNPALAYSDHLAILAQVALSDDSTLNIRVIFSGVHEPNSSERFAATRAIPVDERNQTTLGMN